MLIKLRKRSPKELQDKIRQEITRDKQALNQIEERVEERLIQRMKGTEANR